MKLVFDIGATRTRVALAEGSELHKVVRVETDANATGFASFLGLLEELTKDVQLTAVCGGIAGQLEGEAGHLTLVPNLPAWEDVPVLKGLKQLFECPVYVLNDVMAGGLGEAHYGAGVVKGTMAYFTLSTGVNAVRLVDGNIDTSIVRYEIGQHLVETKQGGVATWESLVSGAAMEQRYGKKPREVKRKAIWDKETEHLALGLYNVILDWTPEVVVLGGSMMRDINLRDLAHDLDELPNVLPHWPQLKRAKLGDIAGLWGSLQYLEQKGL